jgi:indole-3-glycerol phosphate synthase
MNVLEEIMAYKKMEVAKSKTLFSIADLEKRKGFSRSVISLKNSLVEKNGTGIIAEFKRRSPSKGIINNTSTVQEVTGAYAREGAAALSILTDQSFFGGSTTDLETARNLDIPILRKDFILDEYQLVESRAMGADIILLIAACLEKKEVKNLAATAKSLGLEVLLELHDENELGHICDDIDFVGVNNRDLKTFEVNMEKTILLAEKIPSQFLKIAESGISQPEEILFLKKYEFSGFLIGELFMKMPDPTIAFARFVQQLRSLSSNENAG